MTTETLIVPINVDKECVQKGSRARGEYDLNGPIALAMEAALPSGAVITSCYPLMEFTYKGKLYRAMCDLETRIFMETFKGRNPEEAEPFSTTISFTGISMKRDKENG